MQYFDTLPKIIQTDAQGISQVFTNLLARASVIPDLLKNPAVYYTYDIQEGDTPEIIAHKYYGDSYRYWIVSYANNLLDPEWDWPMTSTVFDSYITSKYPAGNTTSTVHHYDKILTQVDNDTNTITVNTVQIDETSYNSLTTGTETLAIGNSTVTITTTKTPVTIYEYELNLNESKRNIKILNSAYVGQVENELQNLMAL